MDGDPSPSPSPSPFRSPFRILNPNSPTFKTPKPQKTPNLKTPQTSFRTRPVAPKTSSTRSKAARKLKALELEQSQSSRKAQIHKQKSLKSLSKTLSIWLNFLLQNPTACNCNVGEADTDAESRNGKRDSLPGSQVGIDGPWRNPKRQRDSSWRPEGFADVEPLQLSSTAFSSLQNSLQQVCSFDDLTDRMRGYLSAEGCKEVFSVMSKVTKNIDEKRLRMRSHCPIVTDVRLKEQAMRVLMCYNPMWLRIGLYIVFGGDSLLPNGNVESDYELGFIRMIAEKQLFLHSDLAKMYAYNKSVEGLYRPGYYEALGNVILKRFLLLVLVLDRAKSQSSLPLKFGIDGIDGGSPLLFGQQTGIKSSRQVIQEFLSTEIMHGEGDLISHLVIVGYKVSYQQYPLLDYDFSVKDLFDDLRDGVRLCRAIQLLISDTSILTKVMVPSDTPKKNLVNCGVALQYLKQAGVPLSDEDGFTIVAEDIASGEKELTLSLLWNTFVHLQVPLLVNKTLLLKEICKVRGEEDHLKNKDSSLLELILQWIQAISLRYNLRIPNQAALLDGKAMWCLIDYYFRHELHCSSSCTAQFTGCPDINFWAADSDAIHHFIISQKLTTMLGSFPEVLETSDILESKGACNDRSVIVLLVFLSSQLIGQKTMDLFNIHKLLGCNCRSPEVKRMSSHRCFLSSEPAVNQDQLDEYNSEDIVRKFKVIQAWWRDMAKHHNNCEINQALHSYPASKNGTETEREKASKIIQSRFRGFVVRRKYMKIKTATSFLQTVVRAWLSMKMTKVADSLNILNSLACQDHPDILGRHFIFMVQRHSFVNLRKSVKLIQRAARAWMTRRHKTCFESNVENVVLPGNDLPSRESGIIHSEEEVKNLQLTTIVTVILIWRRWQNHIIKKRIAATKVQSCWRGCLIRSKFFYQKKAIVKIQNSFRSFKCRRDYQQCRTANRSAAIIQSQFRGLICRRKAKRQMDLLLLIQNRWRGWLIRRDYLLQREAAKTIQSEFRCLKIRREFLSCQLAAIEIQRFARGQLVRNRLLGASFHCSSDCVGLISNGNIMSFELKIFLYSIMKLQRSWRRVLLLRSKTRAAITIQSHIRGWIARKAAYREFQSCQLAAIEIQRFVRGQLARNRLLGASFYRSSDHVGLISNGDIISFELKIFLYSVMKLQRSWRRVLLLKSKRRAAIIIQSHIRGWIARKAACREKRRITVIQAYWRGYLTRKDSREKISDLRLRVQRSLSKGDDGMRLINRLVVALSELLSTRSLSSILHTCTTLDVATTHSQRCAETLVDAGAVDTLLKLSSSMTRSVPDQEVLKHSLSTLRNISRYPHLADVLIDTKGSVEIILTEMLRNKGDGYFIAADLLKKLCSTQKGVDAILSVPALKRLFDLVNELNRKVAEEKRRHRNIPARDFDEKRLREATDLLRLIKDRRVVQ